jgi:hypothetical protein
MNNLNLCAVAMATVLVAGGALTAAAQPVWNERTELKFDSAVQVPGRTLPAGTYTFKLADSKSSRQVVQIFDDQGNLLKTTIAVPRTRSEPKGDITLALAHTSGKDTPPAIVAWFYPGELTGHEFVYPDEQARQIASQSKTLVLSTDIDYGKLEGWETATLHKFDSKGERSDYSETSAAANARRQSSTSARTATADQSRERDTVGTTGMADRAAATTVTAGEVADHPDRYYGKTLSVTAEVEDVYNKSVFSLDEDKLWSTGRDVIVVNPRPGEAARDDTEVTVVGPLRRFTMAEFRRDFDYLDWDLRPEITGWIEQRPVIVAQSIRTSSGQELVRPQ